MDIEAVVRDIKANDDAVSRDAVQTIYTHYGNLSEEEVAEIVPSVVYYLWKLPKFSVQQAFVLELLEKTDDVMRRLLFRHMINSWDSIQLVRMDKFFYLVKRLLGYYPLDVETIARLFGVTQNAGLRAFIVRCVVERLADMDAETEDFLAEFASKCPPMLLLSLKSLRFRRDVAMKYAASRDVGKRNRLALYAMIR